jgi:hypothetical protein
VLYQQDGSPFATGKSVYLDEDLSQPSATARIQVRVAFEGQQMLALLDTGAAWSVVQTEFARALGLLERDGEPKTISSRHGTHDGKLVRVTAELLAEEGTSIQLDSTVFVSEDWTAGTFVGYHGLLERVRFAVDPSENSFLFGPFDSPLGV